MTLEQLRDYCLSFPGATEDIKWQKDLCFCVGEKMFCVTSVDASSDAQFSFKCTPERFTELTEIDGIIPAPYAARYYWVSVEDPNAVSNTQARDLIARSYRLVFDKLPKRLREGIGG